MNGNEALDCLTKKMTIIKDRIRGVVHRTSNGLYLHGRPGTSKTHLARSMLRQLGVPHHYHSGHITPLGLFSLFAEHPDKIIVLDDVSAIFDQPIALQLLLAALGNTFDGAVGRTITYRDYRGVQVVPFSGGVICISNLPLRGVADGVVAALKDRVPVINYEPTDEEITALIYKIAGDGVDGVLAEKAREVADYVLAESGTRGLRPSVRLFVDKAIKDFKLHSEGKCESDWKDLVISNLQEEAVEPKFPMTDLRQTEKKSVDCRIALDIYTRFSTRKERFDEWKGRTGKSEQTLYRRRTDLVNAGLLNPDIVEADEDSRPVGEAANWQDSPSATLRDAEIAVAAR